jgi:hypothetical protein
VLLALASLLVAAGALLPRLLGARVPALSAAAFLFASAGFALYMSARLTSLLYERPLRRQSVASGDITKRPWVFFLIAALLHVETAVSVGVAVGLDPATSPLPLRIAVVVSLILSGVPFWIWLLHPLAVRSRAREIHAGSQFRFAPQWRGFWEPVRALGRTLGEIVRAAHRRRRTP